MSFILLLSLLTVWVLNDSYFWIISLIDSDIHKRKKPSSPYMDNAVKAARSKPSKPQLRSGCFIFNIAFLVCCAHTNQQRQASQQINQSPKVNTFQFQVKQKVGNISLINQTKLQVLSKHNTQEKARQKMKQSDLNCGLDGLLRAALTALSM